MAVLSSPASSLFSTISRFGSNVLGVASIGTLGNTNNNLQQQQQRVEFEKRDELDQALRDYNPSNVTGNPSININLPFPLITGR